MVDVLPIPVPYPGDLEETYLPDCAEGRQVS
jgi:hypothetical protein